MLRENCRLRPGFDRRVSKECWILNWSRLASQNESAACRVEKPTDGIYRAQCGGSFGQRKASARGIFRVSNREQPGMWLIPAKASCPDTKSLHFTSPLRRTASRRNAGCRPAGTTGWLYRRPRRPWPGPSARNTSFPTTDGERGRTESFLCLA